MKRLIDILASVVLLIVTAPVMLVVAIMVRGRLGRPVLFRQVRPGKDEKLFTLLKFRTMTDATDARGQPLSDAERLTPLGAFLRSSSLDELPEFWNVLKGDMSLVGPRPLLVDYLPLYSARQRLRHSVKPGVTGWAQVNGRNEVDWETKLEMDAWYAENHSFAVDMKILAETVRLVVMRKGISSPGHATAPVFRGSPGAQPAPPTATSQTGDSTN